MKKIILPFIALIIHNVCVATTNPVADISSVNNTYGCNNGSIRASNIHNDPGNFGLDQFDITLYKNGAYYDKVENVSNGGWAEFYNLGSGNYTIRVYFDGAFDNGTNDYSRTLDGNNYPCPNWVFVFNTRNETFPGCGDGIAYLNNGQIYYNQSAGVHTYSGSFSCYCSSVGFSVNGTIGSDPPGNLSLSLTPISSIQNNAGNIPGRIGLYIQGAYNLHHYEVDVKNITSGQVVQHLTGTGSFFDISNLQPDTYSVSVTEYRKNVFGSPVSCAAPKVDTVAVSLISSNCFFSPSVVPINITTGGCGNGMINVNVPNINNSYYSGFWNIPWQARYSVYAYDSAWNNIKSVNGFDSISLSGLSAGTYNLVVTGQRYDDQAALCPVVINNVVLIEPACNLNLQTSSTPPSYYNCNDGTITVNMQNYSDDCTPQIRLYDSSNTLAGKWLPANGTLPYTFTDMLPGTYRVEAYAGSCTDYDTIVVQNGICDIQFGIETVPGLHGCNGNSMQVTYFGNVCGALNFSYQNNDAPFNSGTFDYGEIYDFETDAVLPPGNYTVTGSTGSCSVSQTILIADEPCNIGVSTLVNTNNCSGSISGFVYNFCTTTSVLLKRTSDNSLVKSMNTTTGIFSFDTLNNGNYYVVVNDGGNCSTTATNLNITGLVCNAPGGRTATPISTTKATLNWTVNPCAVGYQIQYREKKIPAPAWNSVQGNTNAGSKTISGLAAGKTYEWTIRTKCTPTFLSAYSSPADLFTMPTSIKALKNKREAKVSSDAMNAQSLKVVSGAVYIKAVPNPANNLVDIFFTAERTARHTVDITDINGKLLIRKEMNALKGENKMQFNISSLAAGVYMIVVKDAMQTGRSIRLIKR